MTFDDVLKANGFTFDRLQGPLQFFSFRSIRAAIATSSHCDPQLSMAAYKDDRSEAHIIGHWHDPRKAAEEIPGLLWLWGERQTRAC